MSAAVATKGAAQAFTGGSVALLGQLAGMSPWEWFAVLGGIFLSLLSSNLASLAVIDYNNGHDRSKVARERRLRVGIFAAQYVIGVLIAAKLGDLWSTMAACLVVGWTGTQALDWLAKQTGFGGGK